MDFKNKKVESFFLDYLPKKEDIALSRCSLYLTNYYLEAEGQAFQNGDYNDQDERIEAMFPGMPYEPLNLLKLKAYSHRKTDHQETENEDRITTLNDEVSKTDYQEFTIQQWWED